MDGLMHPIGPETTQTYWVRRAVVIVALVVLVASVGFMINGLSQAQGAGEAAAPTAATAPAEPTPAQPAPSPSATPEQTPVPSAAPSQTPEPQTSESRTPEPQTPESRTPEPQAPSRAPASFQAPSNPITPAIAPAPQPAPQQPAEVGACDPAGLRVGVGGPTQVRPDTPVGLRITMANSSGRRCLLEVNEKTFELKVYSGNDRIWSTQDCVIGMPPRAVVVEPDRDLTWDQEWWANRSVSQCRRGPEALRSGTYVATAQLKGAKPAQLVMQVRA